MDFSKIKVVFYLLLLRAAAAFHGGSHIIYKFKKIVACSSWIQTLSLEHYSYQQIVLWCSYKLSSSTVYFPSDKVAKSKRFLVAASFHWYSTHLRRLIIKYSSHSLPFDLLIGFILKIIFFLEVRNFCFVFNAILS